MLREGSPPDSLRQPANGRGTGLYSSECAERQPAFLAEAKAFRELFLPPGTQAGSVSDGKGTPKRLYPLGWRSRLRTLFSQRMTTEWRTAPDTQHITLGHAPQRMHAATT